MSGALIVSVSGIRNETLDQAAEFAAEMDARGVPLSLLVAPRLKDKYRLVRDEQTQEWLRGRRDAGDAIVLHGYDQAATKRRRAEFASLPQHEAMLRLMAADRVLEQTGLRTRVFAPPRWIASPGAIAALPVAGFRVAALHNAIHDLVAETAVRARVYGIGGGFRTEQWWFRMIVLGAERISRRGGVLRLSVTAKQLGSTGSRQTILDAVDIALHHEARPDVYRWSPPGMRQIA
ncbi:DUF2334 domain-containing protein [Aldersonia kunmingensis]|uniref:DUF2334 domain-containing protein n=1 Tax=Aldersonia kunmingensis TaxID=408066 RepID=UPI00082C24B0|nr:DUF2334 domain-containing protein [Aldersonia kunmingensis]